MSGHGKGKRRGGGGHDGHEGPDERWLLTYADMITLLMALFIVMWSMSTVNISRFAALKQSLSEAFNGNLVQGGASIQDGSAGLLPDQTSMVAPNASAPIEALDFDPVTGPADPLTSGAKADLESLRRLQQKIDNYAKSHALAGKIHTEIDERGLVIRVLTDDLLFESGHARLQKKATPLLSEVAHLVVTQSKGNPVRVEGNTDNRPISTAEFRSNWDLSAARATAVMNYLLERGLAPTNASVGGYADQRPLASNETAAGRSLNRRVEIVVLHRAINVRETGAHG
jgi:chemotaxis protein MotB